MAITELPRLWKYAIQGYGNVIFKAMEICYSKLWKHTIQGYGNILSKGVETYYSKLWKHTIQRYGNQEDKIGDK